jgi:N-methylhydantoinase A
VTVDLPAGVFKRRDRKAIKRLFDAMHELRYGTSAPAEGAEIVSLRATVAGEMRKPAQAKVKRGTAVPPTAAQSGKRRAYFDGGFRMAPTFRRAALLAGNKIKGPALIEEHASTTVLMPGDACEVDAWGNLVIAVGRAR